ncbi:hypothetical protein P4O66_008575 [Electrophorus voltai]|uniref:Uncharacterized protein n=1 Tax=Electrophorus voltai TaxID=2609070 RepID=A0AAD8ZEX7_9TELE|nr:hypothetical protein P4O66_008575 [Electrophorus voltai]
MFIIHSWKLASLGASHSRVREACSKSTRLKGMGVKVLLCFPFYRRCKERCKNRQCPRETESPVSSEERKTRLSSSTSMSSEGDSSSSLGGQRAFFSQKARVSLRHQIDSNINEVDATY